MTADTFSELRALVGRDDISFREFEAVYTRLIENGDWGEAVFLTSLMYLQAKNRADADAVEILALLKTTMDGCIDREGNGETGPKSPAP